MSIKNNFPDSRPSLVIDFAESKNLDSRITFTRSGTASYYDGKTTAKAEENLLGYSQIISVWAKSNSGTGSVPVVTDNYAAAPDGTTTASRVQLALNGGTTGSDVSRISNFVTYTGACTLTVYLKTADASTKLVTIDNGSGTNNRVTVTGAWQRFSFVGTGGSGFAIRLRGDWATSDSADLLVWGAQLELRSTSTAYVATVDAPITNYLPVLQTAATNVARFDHDPITGESLGLMIEGTRTNLFTNSNNFSSSTWVYQTNTSTSAPIGTASATVSPDGGNNAWKISIDAGAGTFYSVFRGVGTISTTSFYTYSMYMKAAETTVSGFTIFGNGYNNSVNFNLSNGTVTSVSFPDPNFTATNYSMVAVGGGWYRGSITWAHTTATTGFQAKFGWGSGVVPYQGIYVWGAQLEVGANLTSYIPTTAATVTRSADIAVMTGTSFSSWYNAEEGTIYGMAKSSNLGANLYPTIAIIDDGTNQNANILGYLVNSLGGAITVVDGVRQHEMYPSVSTHPRKGVLAYKANDFATSYNGGSVATDTSGSVPTNVDRMRLGHDYLAATTGELDGTISKIIYYPKRLTNAQLQALTGI
jgi:hypothetical protein